VELEEPTEPLPPPPPASPLAAPPPPPQAAPDVFAGTRYAFTTGLRAGEQAAVRDANGDVLLTYRSFTNVVGIVAALMTAIVALAGLAAVVFLIAEGRMLTAGIAVALSAAFAGGIATLVPSVTATLFEREQPRLTVTQLSRFSFPSATYAITDPDGRTLARLRRSIFTRLGRNCWTLLASNGNAIHGRAIEESFPRAILRKVAGKFSRTFDANVEIWWEGIRVAAIIRRPDTNGVVDYLDMNPHATIDRRVAVALATVVLGSEP
jgi:hypothetical protein